MIKCDNGVYVNKNDVQNVKNDNDGDDDDDDEIPATQPLRIMTLSQTSFSDLPSLETGLTPPTSKTTAAMASATNISAATKPATDDVDVSHAQDPFECMWLRMAESVIRPSPLGSLHSVGPSESQKMHDDSKQNTRNKKNNKTFNEVIEISDDDSSSQLSRPLTNSHTPIDAPAVASTPTSMSDNVQLSELCLKHEQELIECLVRQNKRLSHYIRLKRQRVIANAMHDFQQSILNKFEEI